MHDCKIIEVTRPNGDSSSVGLYVRTDDRASTPTKNSTWKHPNKDRAIFYAGNATEWRLGKKGHQNTDNYYFKGKYRISKYIFFIWIFQKSFEKARLEPHFSNSILHQNLLVETNHKNQIFSNLSGSRELPLQSEEWIGKVNDYSYDPIQPANSYDYDSYDSYDYDSYHYEGPAEEPVQVKCTSIAGKKIELCIVKAH